MVREKKLFKKWKEKYRENNFGFIEDGIIDEEIWEKQPIKVVLLFKEWNDGGHDSNDEMYSFLKNGARYSVNKNEPTFKKMTQWVIGLHDENVEYQDLPKINQEICSREMSKVACVNIKKRPGNESASNTELKKYVISDAEFIKEQLELYPDASVYITCGGIVSDLIMNHVNSFNGTSWQSASNNEIFRIGTKGEIFIKYGHPAGTKYTDEEYYNRLMTCYKQAILFKRKNNL